MVRGVLLGAMGASCAACALVAGLSTEYAAGDAADAGDAGEPLLDAGRGEADVAPKGALAGEAVDLSAESDASVDLTAAGTLDWIHWGAGYDGGTGVYPGIDRKTTGRLISDVVALFDAGPDGDTSTIVGAYQYTEPSARAASWSDGTPTPSAANAGGYIWVDDVVGSGFALTVPADRAPRALSIYCGGWHTTGTLRAHLSDESAPDFVLDAPRPDAGGYTVVYTLRYRAASDGEKLTVQYLTSACPSDGCGSVDLMAAWLR